MNVVIIMSGGVGRRFGSMIPKQYNLIGGQPVIDYVVDAVKLSQKTDKVVVVIDEQWIEYSETLKNSGFDFAPNGDTRVQSMKNGLDFIKRHYACNKVVIVDSVRPFLYADLIDDYFDKLDEYDAVITAEKITGGFTDIHDSLLDREDYIITNSPEGFNFPLLYNHFDVNFPYQETAGMLPKGSKRYYNYNFKNNLKITYDFELKYAEMMLASLGHLNQSSNVAFFDRNILITDGLRMGLLRDHEAQTLRWLDEIYQHMPELISKWGITSVLPNQVSRNGLLLEAKSQLYGDVVMKFIPEFVGRYERELEATRILPQDYMCRLLDHVDDARVMLLERVKGAKYAAFEENIKLTAFFKKVLSLARPAVSVPTPRYIPDYEEELKRVRNAIGMARNFRKDIAQELDSALALYMDTFAGAPKYIVHMDLHAFHILDNGAELKGIDPVGFIAPVEFELVRFIRNDVREHKAFGDQERFDLLIHSFGRFCDKTRLVKAFMIDTAFCAASGVLGSQAPDETLSDLKLIQIARNWLDPKNSR